MTFEIENGVLKNCEAEAYETVADIPEGVMRIGMSAFVGQNAIEEVILPDSLNRINSWAFQNCTRLKKISFPAGIQYIDSLAFKGCTALEEIVLPEGMKRVDTSAFSGCTSLKRVVLPESVKEISTYAFSGCTSLESVTLSARTLFIAAYAFQGCEALENINLPADSKAYGPCAFQGCKKLMVEEDGLLYLKDTSILYEAADKSIMKCVIPLRAKQIETGCFSECKSLRKVVIGGHVKVIGVDAFSGCDKLKEVEIGEGVEEIGAGAFAKCVSLETVTLPESLRKIGGNVFEKCKKLKAIEIGVKEIPSSAFEGCDALAEVTLKEGVEVIYRDAFKFCKKIKGITFPSTIKKVLGDSFEGCKLIEKMVFPAGLKELECSAFVSCGNVREVYIPAGVEALSWSGMWGRAKELDKLEYIEIGGKFNFEKKAEWRNPAGAVWEMLKALEKTAVCLVDTPCDDIPAAVRKRAVFGYAEGVMRGAAIADDLHAGYLAYIKKSKTKLIDEAAGYPALVRLMMREKLIAADKVEQLLKAVSHDGQLVEELKAYSDSNFSAAQKEKSKAKAKSGDDARAQRLKDADAGKGGLTFASDVDFNTWGRGTTWGAGKNCFENKAEMEQFLGKRGMKLAATLTGKVDFLIIQNNTDKKGTSAKIEKAKTLGIPTITEKELLQKADVWKELDRSMSEDGKTYTIDASADFVHEFFTDGRIPETVETINLSAVALTRDDDHWRSADKIVMLSPELSKKIVITDLKKVTTKDDKHIDAARYIYGVVGRSTLDEFHALMDGKRGEIDMLTEIFGRSGVSPINDDTPVSEEALEAIKLTGMAKEIVKLLTEKLIGKKTLTLTYAESGNKISKETLMLLLTSLASRRIETVKEAEGKRVKDTQMIWRTFGSKEVQLIGLLNREQLRKTIASLFPMEDGMEHIDEDLPQVAAIRLCGVDAAKGMIATMRELERKNNSFGISNVRWALLCGIKTRLGYNEDRDVLMYLDKVKHLDWAASARGMKEEELRAELLGSVDLGLDENNSITLDYGPRQIRAELLTDLTFTFTDLSKNKAMRTLPKAGKSDDADKAAAAQAEFKRIREQIKTMSTIYLNKVKEMYYQGSSMKKVKWEELFMASQISLRMAHGVLWGVFDKDDNLKTAFCVQGNKCCNVNGEEISVRKDALIGVVDLAQLEPIARGEWRKYFSQDEIPQPVKQVWQPLCLISIKDAKKRYMGCRIEPGTLQGMGWDIYAEEQDTCVHSEYISAEVDYWSRHGSIHGSGNVTDVTVHINHDVDEMTDHEKRLWNQSVQKLDYYLHPESKAEDAIRAGDVSQVREWVECGLISADNLSDMIKVSTDAEQVAVTAYLLELGREMQPADEEEDEWAL